jgi:type I restriction enzyme, S subunit
MTRKTPKAPKGAISQDSARMSSKPKTSTVKPDGKPVLVPRLRFPGFRDAAGWKRKSLAQICHRITNGKANAQDHEEAGVYPLFDRSAVIKRSSEFMFDGEAVILPGEGMRFVPKFFRGKFNLHQRAYALMEHQADARFVYHSLDYLQESLAKMAVKSTVLSLRLPIVESFAIGCPKSAEQQKIAECLSSVDELISAQAQKLDALKVHKKGLMQQLFPHEGETQPRLRFPEFQNAGEWVEQALGQLATYENGKAYEQDITEEGKYVVVNSRFISTNGAVRKYTNAEYLIARFSEVLMVLSDLPKGKALAKCYFVEADDRYAVNQRVCRLKPLRIDGKFLCYTLNRHPRLLAFDDGLNQTHLSKGAVTECPLCVPMHKAEQQRIADCLTSLDELIVAQTQKLGAIKTHKKGLMQQLFPSPEEVEA